MIISVLCFTGFISNIFLLIFHSCRRRSPCRRKEGNTTQPSTCGLPLQCPAKDGAGAPALQLAGTSPQLGCKGTHKHPSEKRAAELTLSWTRGTREQGVALDLHLPLLDVPPLPRRCPGKGISIYPGCGVWGSVGTAWALTAGGALCDAPRTDCADLVEVCVVLLVSFLLPSPPV